MKKVFLLLLSLLIVVSLSFRPSQSPSYDLGCFCRIEKSGLFVVRIPVAVSSSHTRARARAMGQRQSETRASKTNVRARARRQEPAKYCYVRKKSEEALRCVTRSCFGKLYRFLVVKHFRWSM